MMKLVEKTWDVVAAALLALFAPIYTMLLSTGLLVVCDLITGMLAAKKRGELIMSGGIKRTVVKLCLYQLTIILAHVTEHYLTGGTIPVLNVVTSIIGITELKSCVENINVLAGGKVLDMVMAALDKHGPRITKPDKESPPKDTHES